MDEINMEYEKLIYSIINKKFYFCNNKDDLFQVGYIGLNKALNNYDESLNVKFLTYAYKWIYGEIYAYLNQDKVVKQSRELTKLYLKISKAAALLCQNLMHEPTYNEIAEYLEIEPELVEEALISSSAIIDIDDVNPKYNDDYLNNIALREELEKLSVEELKIIEKRYMDDLTQQETAKELGISQVQVSRKEQKIITKLKNNLVA